MSEDIKKDLTAEIRDLVVEFRTDYGVVQALNGLELEIERGKTLGLVGETGAGKTTTGLSLLRHLCGAEDSSNDLYETVSELVQV